MPRRYSTSEVIKVLESFGFVFARDKVHAIMTKRGRPVPLPKGRNQIRAGTMSSILRLAGIERKEFDERARRVL